MAAKRKGIMDIKQVLHFKLKGLSNRRIATLLNIHRNTVNEYVQLFERSDYSFSELEKLSDLTLQELLPNTNRTDSSRYESLHQYFSENKDDISRTGFTRKQWWNDYLRVDPEGYGKSQFNHHFKKWIGATKASGKLIHKAGEKLYVDYSGKKLFYINKHTGEQISVEVFVGILPCSMMTYVEASPSQKREDFIESMNNCLFYFGGVPQAVVTDNLKSSVQKASKYEPILNKTFKDFSLHYGCALNPSRAYSPQDKALVESAVKLVYQRIFYPLQKMTFFSLPDLNKEIARLLGQYNDYLLTLVQQSRHQQFVSFEQSQLSPLPGHRYEIKDFKRATVQKMGYIFISKDKHYYSVPNRFIGKKVEIQYDRNTVEVYYKSERIAIHARNYQAGKYSTIKDHLSSTHLFYQQWSPAFFEKLAQPHGQHVEQYVHHLISEAAYPEVAYKQCLGVISLSKTYGAKRLNKACKLASHFHRHGYHILKDLLDNQMDQLPTQQDDEPEKVIPEHSNIRGALYFQKLLNLFI